MNSSCSSCAIALDYNVLQQVFWLSEVWSFTIDTVSVIVTTFNGSNATAVTSTKTVLGDLNAISASHTSYLSSLFATVINNDQEHYNHNASLLRINGCSVGTTSFAYGQAYGEACAIKYRYMTPNSLCPRNMTVEPGDTSPGEAPGCSCLMNSWFSEAYKDLVNGVETIVYSLDRTYYQPLPSTQINESNAGAVCEIDGMLQNWDGEKFKAWLAGDEAFKSAFPNWRIALSGMLVSLIIHIVDFEEPNILIVMYYIIAGGPPAAKVPVDALTATVSTTVAGIAAKPAPTPAHEPQPKPPGPEPTPKS